MRYLVTGGAGFIGSHLVDDLLESDHDVLVIDDLSAGDRENLPEHAGCSLLVSRVQDTAVDSCEGVNGVFHLAAQSSVPRSVDDFFDSSKNNLLSTLRVFDWAKELGVPVVYASSSAIYGELSEGDDTSYETHLVSPYAVDKLAMEQYAAMAWELYGVPSIGLRFFNVYGPRQDPNSPYSGVISIFIKRVNNEELVTLNGGYQTRDFVYIRDVVRITLKAMKTLTTQPLCERVNVCTGRSTTISGLLDAIVDIVGNKPDIEHRKLPPGDPEKSSGTWEKMCKMFSISLDDLTPLNQGLSETVRVSKE